jgi:hypothetical protein
MRIGFSSARCAARTLAPARKFITPAAHQSAKTSALKSERRTKRCQLAGDHVERHGNDVAVLPAKPDDQPAGEKKDVSARRECIGLNAAAVALLDSLP